MNFPLRIRAFEGLPWLRQAGAALAVPLLAVLILCPTLPAAAQGTPDLQVTLFSDGSGTDTLAVAYAKKPEKGVVESDFQKLAGSLGAPPPKVKVSHDGGITVGEAKLPNLTNWSTGLVNLDPLINTYKHFGRFRVSCFFMGTFPLQSAEPVVRPPVRIETRVQGNTVDYQVWIDQSRGVPATVPSVAPRSGPGWLLWVGVLVMVLVVGLGAWLIVRVLQGQRRCAVTGEGNG